METPNQPTSVELEEGGNVGGNVLERDWQGNVTKVIEYGTQNTYSINQDGKFEKDRQ